MQTNNNINKNKNINSTCSCNNRLAFDGFEIIMINPCEHLVHKKCFYGTKFYSSNKCPYCKINVESVTRLSDYKHNPNVFQKCVDILSLTNVDDMMDISYNDVLFNIPEIAVTLAKVGTSKGHNDGKKIARDILKAANVKIKVKGLEKIKKGPKVFISNHTSYLDFLAIFYVLGTGFVSSSTITDNPLSKRISNIIPTYIVEIGKSQNSVEGMKKYVEEFGSICLFPEGMLTHNATISKFRTGAFYIGYPVYPIVLKYSNNMTDVSIVDFICKAFSEKSETITLTIMDPFYPPFDDEKIELVRFAMGEEGNLLLARTSNRDVNNEKEKEHYKKSNGKH